MKLDFIKKGDTGWVLIPKNASTFLTSTSYTKISFKEFLSLPKRSAYLRPPIDRFYSCFQHFNSLLDKGVDYQGFDLKLASQYETFVDFALLNVDPHWSPQSDFILKSGRIITNQNYILRTEPSYINASPRIEFNRLYRINEIRKFYEQDEKIIRQIKWQ